MHTRFTLFATVIIASPMLALGVQSAAAEPADAMAAVERMCDYCADYTDAATSAGVVQTAYQAGMGYTATTEKAAASVAPKKGRS